MKPRNPMSLAARGRKLLALSLGVRRRNYFSTLNGRDAKVSRQPEQLQRANGPRYGDEVKLVFPGKKHRDIADYLIVKANPEIASAGIAIFMMWRSYVHPTGGMKLLADRTESLRIVHSRLRKTVTAHCDSIYPGNYPAKIDIIG